MKEGTLSSESKPVMGWHAMAQTDKKEGPGDICRAEISLRNKDQEGTGEWWWKERQIKHHLKTEKQKKKNTEKNPKNWDWGKRNSKTTHSEHIEHSL